MHHTDVIDRQMPDPGADPEIAGDERTLRRILVAVLALTIIGGGIDLAFDAPSSWLSTHVFYEVSLIFAASFASIWLWRGWWASQHRLVVAQRAMMEQAAERDAWRKSAEGLFASFGKAIDDRLAQWGLTSVEREVALHLLKGKSHKQIAYATGRSERTVRQHAVAVYQKSGLRGRAELAAFFLEAIPDPK